MFSGFIRHLPAAWTAVAVVVAMSISPCRTAIADPGQDQKFFDLLGQKEIPPVDNANSLIATAKKACAKLDEGMPAGDLVELIRNNGFNENPLTRLQPQDRITRTITQFITASVEAYCPYDKGKIASIAAFRAPSVSSRIMLASSVGSLHAGDIAPTKPLPVPAQHTQAPQEIQPPQQQPPPSRVRPAPPQAPPQPAVSPPPEAPAPAPEAPAAPAPGGGADGGSAPASPTPDQPAPPGHIRLAP